MSHSTELFCNISFNRETYDTLHKVEDAIADYEHTINLAIADLKNFALMTEPEKFCPEGSDVLQWIKDSIEDNINIIQDLSVDIYKLTQLRENWKHCHNKDGKAIEFPGNWTYAYLQGDYIDSVKDDKLIKKS
jgi:hypothetical protein